MSTFISNRYQKHRFCDNHTLCCTGKRSNTYLLVRDDKFRHCHLLPMLINCENFSMHSSWCPYVEKNSQDISAFGNRDNKSLSIISHGAEQSALRWLSALRACCVVYVLVRERGIVWETWHMTHEDYAEMSVCSTGFHACHLTRQLVSCCFQRKQAPTLATADLSLVFTRLRASLKSYFFKEASSS